MRGAKRFAVCSDCLGIRLIIGKEALPALDGYELRLTRALKYRRVEDGWVFVGWGDGARCS
jgi:hypothetical protein